jgi:hypothetical protein
VPDALAAPPRQAVPPCCKSAPNQHILHRTSHWQQGQPQRFGVLVLPTVSDASGSRLLGHYREEGEVSQRLAPAVTAAAEGLARLSAHLDAVAFREVRRQHLIGFKL